MGKPKSYVWTHAKRIDENSAKCNLCNETISAKGGNTTTIKRHLVAIHKIDVDKADATTPSPNITGFLTASKPKLSKARSAEIDRRIAAFVACDGRPISTVEGDGFRDLITYIEPDYDVKSRGCRTLSECTMLAQNHSSCSCQRLSMWHSQQIFGRPSRT